MGNDYLPILLPVTGSILQFLMRQFKNVSDIFYHALAFLLAFGCYWLITPNWFGGDVRTTILALVAWMAVHLPSVWGGTWVTSSSARGAVENSPHLAGKFLVPMTDSK